MVQQDTSSSLHMARASPERRYCELWRSKVDVEQRGAEGDQTRISRRLCVQAPGSCERSLETNQQTKTTSWCKLWPEYGNGYMAWYMDGWGEFQKDLHQGEGKRGRYPPAILRHMGSRLHAETGCKKVYAGEVFELQKKSLEAKETIGDGGGRKYANSQFFNQSKQDTISRVSAVQNSVRGPRWEHWRSGGWNTRSHQQCRLRRDSNNSYGCPTLSHQKNTLQYICCLIITQHIHNSYKTYLYTTQHIK